MSVMITPQGAPLPSRWAVVEGEYVTDVTGQSFFINDVEYPESVFLYPDETHLKSIGLYKIVDSNPDVGVFQTKTLLPYTNIDSERQEILAQFSIHRMSDDDIRSSVYAIAQMQLDAFARSNEYDSIVSACSYVSSTVEKFRREAECCVSLRDQVWLAAFDVCSKICGDEILLPHTVEQVVALLRQDVEWPEPSGND